MLTPYQKYVSLKKSFSVNYKGYDMRSIMAHTFLSYSFDVSIPYIGLSFIKRHLFKALSFSEIKSELENENYDVLFTMSHSRPDSVRFVKSIVETVDNSVLIIENRNEVTVFNVFNILISFIQVFFFNFQNINISFREKIYYFSFLVYYKNCINSVVKGLSDIRIKRYVSFFSPASIDSILIQYFKSKHIATYGLQHGLHMPPSYYEEPIPMDFFNIENFHADYFLAWGQAMKRMFSDGGINPERVLVAGNPIYNKMVNQVYQGDYSKAIICLGRKLYKDDNLKLLDILSQLSDKIKFFIKIHPLDDWENYTKYLKEYNFQKIPQDTSVTKTVEIYNPSFTIVINSTVYYEYYMCGIVSFRYGSSRDLPLGLEDKFESKDELIELIKKFKIKDNVELNAEVKGLINDIFSSGENYYNNILNY